MDGAGINGERLMFGNSQDGVLAQDFELAALDGNLSGLGIDSIMPCPVDSDLLAVVEEANGVVVLHGK
jgi:hypothetical protein